VAAVRSTGIVLERRVVVGLLISSAWGETLESNVLRERVLLEGIPAILVERVVLRVMVILTSEVDGYVGVASSLPVVMVETIEISPSRVPIEELVVLIDGAEEKSLGVGGNDHEL
jgi:hypothetical protein